MTSHRTLGQQIREALNAAGLYQRHLADAIKEATGTDCDLNQVNKWVNERGLPEKDRLIVIIDFLGLDPLEAMHAWVYLGPAKKRADQVVKATSGLRQQIEDSTRSRRGKR